MSKNGGTKQFRRWAFTWFTEATHEEVAKDLDKKCKRWTFQQERGAEGRLHFQGRVEFNNGKRRPEVARLFPGIHVSIEHSAKYSQFYVCKDDSRVDGPWSDRTKQRYIPTHLRVDEWNDMQREVLARLAGQDHRQILFVVDEAGNKGKSTLAGNLACKGEAIEIPASITSADDIVQWCYGLMDVGEPRRIIFLDIPRTIEKKRWEGWISAIETLKKGMLYDKRYSAKIKYVESPKICVFTNVRPPSEIKLTADRWDFYIV